jgi:hypothetical protein
MNSIKYSYPITIKFNGQFKINYYDIDCPTGKRCQMAFGIVRSLLILIQSIFLDTQNNLEQNGHRLLTRPDGPMELATTKKSLSNL